jgi:hypothetical protein
MASRPAQPIATRRPRNTTALYLQAAVCYAVVALILVHYLLPYEALLEMRFLLRRASTLVRRLLGRADAAGWSPCSGACGWGSQSRSHPLTGKLQVRRCYAAGFVAADGTCNMG